MRILPFLFFCFLFSGCLEQKTFVNISFNSSNISLLAEKADNEQERSRGLMWRDELKENEGMLFYFNESDYHGFWMANTKIPLEAIFIDENFTIVDIVEMEPCMKKPSELCKIYSPFRPAKYVLEVNQNFSRRYGIKINDMMYFPLIVYHE